MIRSFIVSLLLAGAACASDADILALSPAVWLRASATAGADGATITTLTDQSGNGRDFTASSTAKPILKTNILNGGNVIRFDATDDLMVGPNALAGTSGLTVVTVAGATVTNGAGLCVSKHSTFGSALGEWSFRLNTATNVRGRADMAAVVGATTYSTIAEPVCHPSIGIFTLAWAGSSSPAIYHNGLLQTNIVNNNWSGLATMPTTTEPLRIGGIPGFTSTSGGDLAELLIWGRKLTSAELAVVHAELKGRHFRDLIVCDGDSLTSGITGSPSASNWRPWPSQAEPLLARRAMIYDVAVQGQTVANVAADLATQVYPLKQANYSRNIYIVWVGTNDLGGDTPANIKAAIASLATSVKAQGFRVVIATILPRSNFGNVEADRQTLNTLLRADFTTATRDSLVTRPAAGISYADLLVNVAGDTRIGDAGDELDTTYYLTDLVHLNNTGAAIPAALFATAVDLLPPPGFSRAAAVMR
jgi:lysophospholipase L1-like esterase